MSEHRRRRPPPTLEERARRVTRDLRGLVRSLAMRHGVARDAPLPLDRVSLTIEVATAAVGDDVPDLDAEKLLAALESEVEAARRGTSIFRAGHVYCFHSESADGEGTRPSDPGQIFAGYSSIGRPIWESFTNVCLARREERVDRLFGDAPEIIALAQFADELCGRVLAEYGGQSRVYRIVGQVAAGMIPVDLAVVDGRGGTERLALTLQVIDVRSPGERRRLQINVIGLTPPQMASAAAEGDPRVPAERLRRTLRATAKRLTTIERRLRLDRYAVSTAALVDEVRPVILRLRSDVQRIFGSERHRTQHAKERHSGAVRPTSSALIDAGNASDERLMFDANRNTVVVIGPKGRAHVFSLAGRHVTSIKLEPGEVGRKTAKARWRPLAAAQITAFRANITAQG